MITIDLRHYTGFNTTKFSPVVVRIPRRIKIKILKAEISVHFKISMTTRIIKSRLEIRRMYFIQSQSHDIAFVFVYYKMKIIMSFDRFLS